MADNQVQVCMGVNVWNSGLNTTSMSQALPSVKKHKAEAPSAEADHMWSVCVTDYWDEEKQKEEVVPNGTVPKKQKWSRKENRVPKGKGEDLLEERPWR